MTRCAVNQLVLGWDSEGVGNCLCETTDPAKTLKPTYTMRPSLEQLPPHRILLVNGNEGSANELGAQLRKHRHLVEIASDWASAVKAGLALQPAIVIVDLSLPGTVAVAIARFFSTNFTEKVVLVADGTAEADDAQTDFSSCFNCHMNWFNGMPLIEIDGEIVKLADRSPENWSRDLLEHCPTEGRACRVLEAGAVQFEPAELAPLIPSDLLDEVRKYAHSGSDLKNYLTTLNLMPTPFSDHWTLAVRGACRWFLFFNPERRG